MSSALSNFLLLLLMIDAIASTRSLNWSIAQPRRRTRRQLLASGTRARAAARHGLRAAIQTMCLSAALMAGMGAVGASRGPVELSEPAPAHQHTAAQVQVVAPPAHVGLARTVTSR